METVVDEKPLSFATSRIVIIDPFTFGRVTEDLSLISLRGANPVPFAGRKSCIAPAKNHALELLRTAERLAPKVPGVRLNIGLVYYRQNDFRSAIEPFETVVRDQPDTGQGRYLLGLCYFFIERWADSAKMLEPLWPQEFN